MNFKSAHFEASSSGDRRPRAPLAGALAVSACLVAICTAVNALIFARLPVFAALAIPLHNRIARASRRLAALLARLANSTFRTRPHTRNPGRKGGPPPIYIPHRRAWLVAKLGHHMAAYMSHLEHLLRDPQTQALLAATPPEALKSLGRTLRPLARLLGADLPPELRLAPRDPGPKPAKPPKPKLPPLLPLLSTAVERPARWRRKSLPVLVGFPCSVGGRFLVPA